MQTGLRKRSPKQLEDGEAESNTTETRVRVDQSGVYESLDSEEISSRPSGLTTWNAPPPSWATKFRTTVVAWKSTQHLRKILAVIMVFTALVALVYFARAVSAQWSPSDSAQSDADAKHHAAHHVDAPPGLEDIEFMPFVGFPGDVSGVRRVERLGTMGTGAHTQCRPLAVDEINNSYVRLSDGDDIDHSVVTVRDIVATNLALLREEPELTVMAPKFWNMRSDPLSRATVDAMASSHFNPCIVTWKICDDSDYYVSMVNAEVINWMWADDTKFTETFEVAVENTSDDLLPNISFSLNMFETVSVRAYFVGHNGNVVYNQNTHAHAYDISNPDPDSGIIFTDADISTFSNKPTDRNEHLGTDAAEGGDREVQPIQYCIFLMSDMSTAISPMKTTFD